MPSRGELTERRQADADSVGVWASSSRLAQEAREEEDEEDLGELRRLEGEAADPDPDACAVDHGVRRIGRGDRDGEQASASAPLR